MTKKGEVVVHRFYAGDKAVWVAEWYEPHSVEVLRRKAEEVQEMGYGDVDIVTDTTGRIVRLK